MARTSLPLLTLTLSLFAAGCPTTHKRCLQNYARQGDGEGDSLRCAIPDAAAADTAPPVCDGGPTMAPDEPGDGVDRNCDGIDGVLSDTVFVAEDGTNDCMGGLTPDRPVGSLPFALELADIHNRGTILMQTGIYNTVARVLVDPIVFNHVRRTVTIVGRYVPVDGRNQWVLRDARGVDRETTVIGSLTGLFVDRASDVKVIGLTLKGEAPTERFGMSVYGLLARRARGLVLRNVRVEAGNGTRGEHGEDGALIRDGAPGRDGRFSEMIPIPGEGATGCSNGGLGGNSVLGPSATGEPAAPGMPGTAGASGAAGGEGGRAEETMRVGQIGRNGDPGSDGEPGAVAPEGYWTEGGFEVATGGAGGSGGNGGGGGGGGGGASPTMSQRGGPGGGGGAGGCGAGGGGGGSGGGGSFGAYLFGSETNAIFDQCAIIAGSGGNGGNGGAPGGVLEGMTVRPARGGVGGAGASGFMAGGARLDNIAGGAGGNGGVGGAAGRGASGPGGPAVAVVRLAGAGVTYLNGSLEMRRTGARGMPGVGPSGAFSARQEVEAVIMTPTVPAEPISELPPTTFCRPGDAGVADASTDASVADASIDASVMDASAD